MSTRFVLACLLCLGLAACNARPTPPAEAPNPAAPTQPAAAPVPSETPLPSPTPSPVPPAVDPGVPGLVKTSLEFYRNGQTYEVVVGYSLGPAFFNATPAPQFPQEKMEIGEVTSASLQLYRDLDGDGETEYLVSLVTCAAYCTETVRVYAYDAARDLYAAADEFSAKLPAAAEYTDLDGDGRLEIVTANYGFCYQCATATASLAVPAVLRYENGAFVDASEDFPALLEAQASANLELAKQSVDETGANRLANYLYAMYRLEKMEVARPIFTEVCVSVLYARQPDPAAACQLFRDDLERTLHDFVVDFSR